jgi:hypothetical protein
MKRKRLITLTVVAALASIALSLLGNAFTTMLFSTSPPPASITPYVHFIAPLFGVVAFFSIVLSVALLPSENASTPTMQSASLQTVSNAPTPAVTFPCPVCKHNTLSVLGRAGNDLILICESCWKTIRVTYNGSTLEKLVVPGLTLIGAIAILNYLDADPTDLFDLFTGFF